MIEISLVCVLIYALYFQFNRKMVYVLFFCQDYDQYIEVADTTTV